MSGGETSGVDLVWVALRAAREAARRNGVGQKSKTKQRPVRTVRRDGREPMGLGAVIGEAGLLAAAGSADPTDPVAVAAVAAEVLDYRTTDITEAVRDADVVLERRVAPAL
ncbi:hypothetical protein GCM10018785_45040 [Streptomyces longispororuber]|uniref:Uncharacterized protein n=1 Tax=Streptomyces longispororuber TaxID=68230 RepID=A0A918ZUZ5_9ACTN|nr:hypothetical protein [Streptomyces longispororuber]GHE71781.1 hypothetical protein GCM10018785_45040 [Streptomyces longispororuber]